jgi:hypothetical protein
VCLARRVTSVSFRHLNSAYSSSQTALAVWLDQSSHSPITNKQRTQSYIKYTYTVYDKRSQDQDADPVSSKQNKKSFPSEINGIAARPKSELLTKFINKPPLFFLSLSLSLLKSKSADDK